MRMREACSGKKRHPAEADLAAPKPDLIFERKSHFSEVRETAAGGGGALG
jgi:hypothetical protein